MKPTTFLLQAFLFIQLTAHATGDSTIALSQLKNAVVYKSGAELTHTTTAVLKQGNNELIIDNISNQLDINSVQIKAESAVTIMGIEFSNNFLKTPEKTPHIQLLEDSLEHLEKEVNDIDLLINNQTDLLSVLRSNKDIKGAQTGLSVAELMKLMDYYKTKSLELQTYIDKLGDKRKKIIGNETKIKNQIEEDEKKNTSTAGRLILQLSSLAAGRFSFTISYITPNAYWVPFYDVRVDDIHSPMKIIYKAKITQTTGIDWKQVKLSLSTSLPSQWGDAPVFKAWFLGYINPVYAMNKSLNNLSVANSLSGRVAGVQVTTDEGYAGSSERLQIRGTSSINQNTTPLYVVNGTPMSADEFSKISSASIKNIEVLKDGSATALYGARGSQGVIVVTLKDGLEDYISVTDNTLDVSFDIDLPYDVPTNGKAQTAILQTLSIPANYKHYAAPKLDKDPYLLAEIPGWESLNLLPGDANIIVDNTYIGKSFIDPSSTSDTLNLTLGRDKRVVVKREKITDFSSVKFLGSNKLQKFTYEITVRNNKKEAVNLLLKDQFPISTDNDIVVELLETSKADVNDETGVLNWKLTLAPGESKKVRFAYSLKYAKNKTVNQ